MRIILTARERSIYEDMIKVKSLAEITNSRKEFWIDQVRITKEELEKLTDTTNKRIYLSPREIIGISIIKLSFIENSFRDLIEQLEFKERILEKFTYKKLNILKIHISGIGDLDLSKKGLFVIIAKLSEDSIF